MIKRLRKILIDEEKYRNKVVKKVKVSCSAVIYEYNQHTGGVDLSDQIKVSNQFDRRCNFPFYVRRTDTLFWFSWILVL